MSTSRKTAKDFFDEPETSTATDSSKIKESNDNEKDEMDEMANITKIENETKEDKKNEKSVESKEELPTATSPPNSTTSSGESTSLTPEQVLYQIQYQQYVQQCQQYYSQYYAGNTTVSDPVYELYTGQPTTAAAVQTPAVSFDSGRANRQMAAYFDPTKFQAVLSPEMLADQQAQKHHQQSRLTAKEIEAFKKKKIEKKKGKNRWFYE